FSSAGATYTFSAPCSASVALPVSAPSPTHTAAGSPMRRATVSSSVVTFLTCPSTWSTRTRTSAMIFEPLFRLSSDLDELLLGEELGGLHATITLVLDDRARGTRWCGGEVDGLGRGVGQTYLIGVDAGVGDRLLVDRLLLRLHDQLEGRVARLVDLLDHRDDRRQLRLDDVVSVVGLTLDLDRAAVHVDLARERELRHTEVLGERGAQDTGTCVGGLRAEDDDVVLDGAQGLRDGVGALEGVRAVERVVVDEDGLVRTHGEGLADGLGGLVGSHRQDGDLTAVFLLEEQRLLDGVLVELVDDAVGRFSVECLVLGVELPFGRRVRDLLDQNDN